VIGLPNPWVILAVLIALGGSYKYGHHNGWWDRDAEMQAEIAKKNEEARETERKLTEQLNSKQPNCRRPTMSSLKNKLLLIVPFVLAGCASPPQVAYSPPQVPPLPAGLQKAQPNLTERLSSLLLKSQPTETGQSTNSTPASTPTTQSGSK